MSFSPPEEPPGQARYQKHTFPGLQKPGDTEVPWIRSYNEHHDLYDAVKLVSSGAAKQTVTNRYKSGIKNLNDAVSIVEKHLPGQSHNVGLLTDLEIFQASAKLDEKEAVSLEKSCGLLKNMPPTHISWVRWHGDKTGARMLVTKTFLKFFLTEFVHTPLASQLKADLVEQHTLNEAPTEKHKNDVINRHIATSGTAFQANVLAGTNHQPDVAPPISNLHPNAASNATAVQTTQADIMAALTTCMPYFIDSLNAARSQPMSERVENEQIAIMRENQAKENERKDKESAENIALTRHKRKLVEQKYRSDMMCQEESLKEKKVTNLQAEIDTAPDDEHRQVKENRLELITTIMNRTPDQTTYVIPKPNDAPIELKQYVFTKLPESSTLETHLPQGTTLLDAACEVRVSVREYVEQLYRHVKLTPENYKELGKMVAQQADSLKFGCMRRAPPEGERYGTRVYFYRQLSSPAIDTLITSYVNLHAARQASHKMDVAESRKRQKTNSAQNQNQGSLDSFVLRSAVNSAGNGSSSYDPNNVATGVLVEE